MYSADERWRRAGSAFINYSVIFPSASPTTSFYADYPTCSNADKSTCPYAYDSASTDADRFTRSYADYPTCPYANGSTSTDADRLTCSYAETRPFIRFWR